MPSRMIYLKDVTSLTFHAEKCIGCGLCMLVCPHGVFERSGDAVVIAARDACMECGACAQNCPSEAVSVRAGVGCAAAIINGILGRDASGCCCVVESKARTAAEESPGKDSGSTGCC